MKKSIIAVLMLVLTVSCLLIGCDKEKTDPADSSVTTPVPEQVTTVPDTSGDTPTPAPTADDVKIVPANVELKVGEKPDWKANVTVTVNGEKVDNPEVTWVLKSGDEKIAGRCTYAISFVYKEQTYTRNGFVNFTKNADVTEPGDNPQNPTDGSMSAVEAAALNAMLAKEYNSYVCYYRYYEEATKELYYEEETDSVQGNVVFVDYNDVNGEASGTSKYYIAEGIEYVNYYFTVKDEQGVESWKYFTMTSDEYASQTTLFPLAFQLYEYQLDASYFVKSAENVYVTKSQTYTDLVADAVFGLGDNQTYKTITLTTNGTDIIGIKGEYSDVTDQGAEYDATVEYKWSNFDSTTVELPDATEYKAKREDVPEHTEPGTGVALTPEQVTALNTALSHEYANIGFSYVSDKGSGNDLITGNGRYDGGKYYDFYHQATIYNETELFGEDSEYYFVMSSADKADVFYIISEYGDWLYGSQNGTSETLSAYNAIKSLGLTADMFVKSGDTYVVKAEKLTELAATVGTRLNFTEAYVSCDVITFTLTLDEAGNVAGWYMLADCVAAGNNVFYWQLTYNYDYSEKALVIPGAGNGETPTAGQLAEIEAALDADMSNVTVNETFCDSTVYYAGNDVAHTGEFEHEAYKDIFKIVDDNGTLRYYTVLGTVQTEIEYGGDSGFINEVPVFDFSHIDASKMKYDSVKGVYTLSADGFDMNGFVYYLSNFAEVYGSYVEEVSGSAFNGFSSLEFKVENGKIASIRMISDAITVSFNFSDYGVTVLPTD